MLIFEGRHRWANELDGDTQGREAQQRSFAAAKAVAKSGKGIT
jgi:hypothetical protein